MKKLLLATIIFAISHILVMAENITVLGIPLTGTIDNFTAKVKSKGYRISPESKNLPIGQRCFEVRFAGEDALLLVSYDKETKNVYDAVLTLSSFNQESLKPKYELFRNQIGRKYVKVGCKVSAQTDRFHNMPMWRFSIEDSKNEHVGNIYLYYWDIPADEQFSTIYQLNIRYRSKDAPSFNDEYLDIF